MKRDLEAENAKLQLLGGRQPALRVMWRKRVARRQALKMIKGEVKLGKTQVVLGTYAQSNRFSISRLASLPTLTPLSSLLRRVLVHEISCDQPAEIHSNLAQYARLAPHCLDALIPQFAPSIY